MTGEQKPEQGGGIEREWLVQIIKEHTFAADAADMILERYTPAEPAEARVRELEREVVLLGDGLRQASINLDAAEAQLSKAKEAMPDLSSVIAWLDNGCDPKHAADELRIYKARIDAALQQAGEVE